MLTVKEGRAGAWSPAPLARMLDYNARWASRADTSLLAKTATGQEPKVLWLGCADSRIPESLLCVSAVRLLLHYNEYLKSCGSTRGLCQAKSLSMSVSSTHAQGVGC